MRKLYLILLLFFLFIVGFVIYLLDKKPSLPANKVPRASISQQTVHLPQIEHVAVIVMENKSNTEIYGNNLAPFINNFLKQNAYALNYSAVANPSLPNYLALIGGNTFNITSDCQNCFINAQNLVDRLEAGKKTWRAYMESMPSPCLIGNAPLYAQKHNPFIYFDNIRKNSARCKNIVPLTQLEKDIGDQTLPNFIFISPNLCNDMHDCSVATGDRWLSDETSLILNSFKDTNSIIMLVWDEGEGSTNKVPFIIAGKPVKKNFVSNNQYTHYSLLNTILKIWNLSPLTDSVARSGVMDDFFVPR